MTPRKHPWGVLVVLGGLATLLAACGSTAGAAPSPSAASPAPATPRALATPAAAPAPSPSPAPEESAGRTRSDLLRQGEDIFLRTAGGVGCQYCHGEDGRGKVGPSIRGKSTQAIRQALGTVLQMSTIELTDEEIEALAAYLEYLESQP